jgi:hypothetical protein
MSKQTIVIDGEGVTATFNSVAISDINTVGFSIRGEREEINLTTIEASAYMVGQLADLQKIEDITVDKKFDPASDLAHTSDNAELAITYKTGKANTKTVTFWCQLKNAAAATLERAPSDGINHELVFYVTNLNGSLVETGPAITS